MSPKPNGKTAGPEAQPDGLRSERSNVIDLKTLSYIEKPDFYAESQAKKKTKVLPALSAAILAITLGVGMAFHFNVIGSGHSNVLPIAAHSSQPNLELVTDSNLENQFMAALDQDHSGAYSDQIKADLRSGKRKIEFLHTMNPGPGGNLIAVHVDGVLAGTLNLSKTEITVPIIYVPGEPLVIQETVAHVGDTTNASTTFYAGDGSALELPLIPGQSITWRGTLK